jgi:hypothetical protein
VGDFFVGIWNSIKGAFAAVGNFFKNIFTGAWNNIKNVFSKVGDFFGNIWNTIKEKFSALGTSIGNAISGAVKKGINGIIGMAEGVVNGFLKLINGAIGLINKIPGVNIPKIKLLSFPRLAKGGVVDKETTAVIGEDGAEAVVPLENNTGWIRKVAQQISNELNTRDNNSDSITIKANGDTDIFETMRTKIEQDAEASVKTVADYQAEIEELTKEHNLTRAELDEEILKEEAKIQEEYAEKMKEEGADRVKLEKEMAEKLFEVNKKYDEDVEQENERHANEIDKIHESIHKTISDKMKSLVDLEEEYKNNVKQVWDDLKTSISDLRKEYNSQLENRTASIADSLGLWDRVTKERYNKNELKYNLETQIQELTDYNNAISSLEERGINEDFMNSLKSMGVGATGQIEALAGMTDEELDEYVRLWGEKNKLARTAAREELEPLHAETEAQIQKLRTSATAKYNELYNEFTEQSTELIADLKQSMIDAGEGGYEELIAQIDEYTSAGGDLMDGVIVGIVEKAPQVARAVSNAVQNAISAAKETAGIHSPSKVMRKEVGNELGNGLELGWSEKVSHLKNKMATDMRAMTARVKQAAALESSRMTQGVGVSDTGFTEVAQAVRMQTAGINSLASEYRRGSSNQVTVPLILDGRELGRAIVDLGNAETVRTGTRLVMA